MAKAKYVRTSSSLYTEEDLIKIRMHPHLLLWIIGFDKMKPIHGQWILDMFGPDDIRMKKIWCHRGSYKSTMVVGGIIWRWLWRPEEQFGLYRKSFTDCVETISTIAKTMKLPEIQELFYFAHGEYPVFKKEKVGDALLDFSFRKNPSIAPSILGLSKNSSIVGKHNSFMIIDDASDLKSRTSKAERKQDQSIFRELTSNIVNRGCPIRVVGTPWCQWGSGGIEDLLVADIKKGIQASDNFKVYHMQDVGLISPKEIEEIRSATTPSLFAANYLMQFIASDDQIFKDPDEGEWDFENCERARAHIDAAYSKEGDTTALTIFARNKKTNKIHAVGFTYPGNVFDHLDHIGEKLKHYGARKVLCERNKDAGWLENTLNKLGFTGRGYVETSNKNNRISVYGLECWEDIIWAYETDPEYMNQILEWQDLPSGAIHDDAPDSMASLIQYGGFSKKNSNSLRWTW